MPLTLAFLGCMTTASAQESLITIGDGTHTNNYVPCYFRYNYSFSQQIYKVEELGTTPCVFTSIDFYNAYGNDTSSSALDIYLLETDKSLFESQTDWVTVREYDRVFRGAVTFTAKSWTTITFDRPFQYEGTKNILLVVHDRKGTLGLAAPFNICNNTYRQALCAYKSSDFDLTDLSGVTGSYTEGKNQIRLQQAPYPTCLRPSSVDVTNITPYTAKVIWEGDGDLWNLQYKQPADDEWTVVSGLTDKTYDLTALTQDASCMVSVQADCGSGETSTWQNASFTTLEACPTPSDLTCTAFTASTATLSWTENGDATQWQISVLDPSTVLDGSPVETIVDAPTNPFTLTGLTEDVTYTLKVRAVSGDLNSRWCSTTVSVQPTDKLCLGLDGTSSYAVLPYDSNSRFSLTQQIYTTEELGTTPCSFNSVDFHLQGSTAIKRNLDIYMVQTDKANFNNTSYYSKEWVPFTADDLVFSGEVQAVRNGWTSIPFSTPFAYDGQHNVVLIVHNTTGDTHSSIAWRTYTTSDSYALYTSSSSEFNFNNLSDITGYIEKEKNRIRLMTGDYTSCQKPTAVTVSNVTANSATVSWTSEASSFDLLADGKLIEGLTTTSYTFNDLEMASVHEVQVRANCGDGSVSFWTNPVSFVTVLCNDEDKCTISYELQDSYGDGWGGNAIQVVDVLTGELLDSWTFTDGTTASGSLAVCNGRKIQFVWKSGYAAYQCSYTIYDNNGDEILTGNGALTTTDYTVDCTSYLTKPVALTCTQSVAPKATLSWTEKGTATQWEISLTDGTVLDGSPVETLHTATQNPYTLTGLKAETTYTAKVRAVNGEEKSRWSDLVTFEVTTTTPIGTKTENNQQVPLNTYYNYSLTEQIYTAEELGNEAKSIETLAFYMDDGTERVRQLDIYMLPTDKTQFETNSDWVRVSEGDLVYSGEVTIAKRAWTTITLDTPYEYDGKSNLLLVVDDNTGTSISYAVYFYGYQDSDLRTIYYRNDATNPDPTQAITVSATGRMKSKSCLRVLMGEPVAVPKPTAFRSTWSYSHSAWLRWEEKGKATQWQLSVLDGSPVETLLTVTKTPYLLEGLKPETTYTVKVRSYHNGTYSRWAGPITITTDPNDPPYGLTAEKTGPTSTELSWYDEDIVTAWQVSVTDGTVLDGSPVETLYDVTEPALTLTGLTPETEYTVKVRAVIPDETCPWSDDLKFTTTEVNPVPRDLEVLTTHTEATVQWLGFSDSYNVRYRKAASLEPLFTDGFEGGADAYTLRDCAEGTGYFKDANYAHSGNGGFVFFYSDNPPQYLISPELTGITEGMKLQFYYKNSNSTYPETFQVGFSATTNDNDAFTFGDVITAADEQWTRYSGDIPAGTKFICLKHTSDDQYFLFIDDIVVGTEQDAEAWQTVNTTEATATISGLTAGTDYELELQGVTGDAVSAWSPTMAFSTQSATTKLFVSKGNWNEAANWTPEGVPTATDDVVVMAIATIPADVVATARQVTLQGEAAIVLKDGGQLRNNTEMLPVTIEKAISGYGNSKSGGYRLLANPMSEGGAFIYPDEAGMTTGSYDLYEFALTPDDGLEWRNYKREEFPMVANNESGYLYANSDDQTLTFSGLTGATSPDAEWLSGVVVNGDVTPYTNGWRIFANTSVSNAYVDYGTFDDEDVFNPVPCNFYKLNADGSGFICYKNYVMIPPGEAVFVEASTSARIHWKYVPLYESAPVAEETAVTLPVLPRHGKRTHQDAHPVAFIPGDANGDGKVTITDAVAVVDYILGNPSDDFNEDAADVSGDGTITITDAVGIVDIILKN